jgi:hypothetical protein
MRKERGKDRESDVAEAKKKSVERDEKREKGERHIKEEETEGKREISREGREIENSEE